MVFEKESYKEPSREEKETNNPVRKPLMIGCSGGGGHNAAILGIGGFLKEKNYERFELTEYQPSLLDHKPKDSPIRKQIQTGVKVLHAPIVGRPIQEVLSHTHLPVLPSNESLISEMEALSKKESKPRVYIDMLLDIYPAGYESAAIWNVLQRADKTTELKKLIELQPKSDKDNHQIVVDYYFNILKEEASKATPYTEIISTQAMALPALCDAVSKYNEWIDDYYRNEATPPPKILIQQYMTDLPTKGAVHFFNALSTLTPDQQQQMNLYGVGMTEEIIKNFFPSGNNFKGIYDIPVDHNPMVRPGFKQKDLDNSTKFDKDVEIKLAGEKESFTITIKENEQIASIMLGSQASADTIEYIETMLKNGMNKVFVFGGTTPAIKEKIDEIIRNNPDYKERIIPLSNQGDKEIAPLMSRSNLVVIRGGGMSVMEQLATNHNKQQTILIHHANSPRQELTSGISWEDENVDRLILDLRERGVHIEKTSPERAVRQIPEARLIAAIKREGMRVEIDEITRYIKKLPTNELKTLVTELENPRPSFSVDVQLRPHLDQCKEKDSTEIQALNQKIDLALKHSKQVIIQEAGPHLKITNPSSFAAGAIIVDTDTANTLFTKVAQPDYLNTLNYPISSEYKSAVTNFQMLQKLKGILNEKDVSPHKKLMNFQSEYEQSEKKLSKGDSIISKIARQIKNQLIAIFPFLSKNLAFQMDLKKHMSSLRTREKEPEVQLGKKF